LSVREPARPRRNLRPRDALGRPLPYGSAGEPPSAEPGPALDPVDSLIQAQQLLAAGRPFHAHEVLEDQWKAAPAEERELWRGLAQLAVGITHAARGNRVGARRLVQRGRDNVARFSRSAPHGLDVDALLSWSDQALAEIDAGRSALTSPRFVGPNQ